MPSTTSPTPANTENRAVVLLSGGLDSTTVLAMARDAGRAVYAISFRYGQRHEHELGCARRQAELFAVHAHVVVDLSHLGALVASGSSLFSESAQSVPKGGIGHNSVVPSTYVPARNTLFLSYALGWAEVLGATELWLGVNAVDYSGYPDCRPEFLDAFETLANLATRSGTEGKSFRLRAPLIDLHKHEIIVRGDALGVQYDDTLSCYDPSVSGDGTQRGDALACGRCDSCIFRRRGFERSGVDDPTLYAPTR